MIVNRSDKNSQCSLQTQGNQSMDTRLKCWKGNIISSLQFGITI